jgi:regulator of telomere elongation helicase 1
LDVEELVTMGKKHKVCSFYHTRELVTKGADLVLLPYNYLFDKDARTSLDIVWSNAIVIFDEAHNLESFASDATSFELSGMDIAGAILEVSRGIDFVSQMNAHGADDGDGLKVENLVKLKAMFLRIEDFIDRKVRTEGGSFAGEYIFEVFRWASITYSNHEVFISFVQTLIERMTEARGGTSGTPKLDHFLKCLKRAFGGSTEAQCLAKAKAFRVYVSPKKPTAKKEPRTLSYWCFAPSLAMRELADMGLRSILVTSGTLSPIMSYSLELGIPFPLTLENPHIIKPHQVHIQVVGRGLNNKNLKSTYERRDDKEYLDELGHSLVELAKIIPGGMLIFFPSYGIMNKCTESWGGPAPRAWLGNQKGGSNRAASFFGPKGRNKAPSNTGSRFSFPQISTHFDAQQQGLCIWKRLLSHKAIVVEPRSSSDMKDVIEDFDRYIAAKKSKGCILMGVCRGKISEGIDFADQRARAVIVTGIPFPPFQDPKVKLKREFLDSAKATAGMQVSKEGGFQSNTDPSGRVSALDCISGSDWYSQQAHRAVNQAVGRVIRHRFDYGAILLMDSRFGEERNQSGMSKWVRPHIRKDDGFTSTVSNLISFYKGAEQDPTLHKQVETNSLVKFCQPKKATKLLQYEPEEVDLEAESLRIAVVGTNSPLPEGTNGDTKKREYGYIRKDRILTHIEVKPGDLQSKKVECNAQNPDANVLAASKTNDVGLRALFDVKRKKNVEMSQNNTGENESSWDTLKTASSKAAKGSISRSGAPRTDWIRPKSSTLQPSKPAPSKTSSNDFLK